MLTPGTKKPPRAKRHSGAFLSTTGRLCACNVYSAWAFLSLSNFKVYCIAGLELVEHYTVEVLRVKKEILCLAWARDESVSTIRKSLDCSCHVFVVLCEKPDPVS